MKFIKLMAAATAMSVLSGCSVLSSITDNLVPTNEIEPPVAPVANEMPNIQCVRDEVQGWDWYEMLCLNLQIGERKTIVHDKVRNDDIKKVLAQIDTDYPQIFWIGNSYSSEVATDGSAVRIACMDGVEKEDIPGMIEEIYAAAEKIIEEIPENSSDYEKVLFVHDYIVNSTEYDYVGAMKSGKDICHTVYGCLINGEAVCSGYAAAFQLIMNMLGIECGTCTGSNHAWNYVNIDGEYYWIDTTWDDSIKNNVNHTYFMITTEQLLNTRTFDTIQGYVPECDSMEYNYFVQNGGYFETYDEDAILSYISENADNDVCELMFGSFEVYEEALNNLIGKSKVRKAEGVDNSEFSYSREDEMFTLSIVF